MKFNKEVDINIPSVPNFISFSDGVTNPVGWSFSQPFLARVYEAGEQAGKKGQYEKARIDSENYWIKRAEETRREGHAAGYKEGEKAGRMDFRIRRTEVVKALRDAAHAAGVGEAKQIVNKYTEKIDRHQRKYGDSTDLEMGKIVAGKELLDLLQALDNPTK